MRNVCNFKNKKNTQRRERGVGWASGRVERQPKYMKLQGINLNNASVLLSRFTTLTYTFYS